jgi:histidyl-tRNA synthetase
MIGENELKEGLVMVKEQKWELVDGKKSKIQSEDKGQPVKRAELTEWIKATDTFKNWASGKLL